MPHKYTAEEVDKLYAQLERIERTGYVPGIGDPRQKKYERLVYEYEHALQHMG